MYRLNAATPLTTAMIEKYIELNKEKDARQEKLYNYYKAQQKILDRTMEDASKPNNKIVNPYGHYITDIMTGYFMGEPVKYGSEETEFLEIVEAIFNYNDEADENTKLA